MFCSAYCKLASISLNPKERDKKLVINFGRYCTTIVRMYGLKFVATIVNFHTPSPFLHIKGH